MGAAVLFLLSACETTAPPIEEAIETETLGEDRLGEFMRELPPEPERIAPGPSNESYIGQSVVALEGYLGAASFVRPEGNNEFRRYDLGSCRLYAVIIPAGGNVASLAVGPAVAGEAMPTLEECMAIRSSVGS